MVSKILCQGAEAIILLKEVERQGTLVPYVVIKDRTRKNYRIKELDEKIRKSRTRREAKLLTKASGIIKCPKPFFIPRFNNIKMPFIEGKKLSEHLDNFSLKEQLRICKQIGNSVGKLHDANIIHGDLTTSNMILKSDKVHFIDFGLGFHSTRIEDRAVDLHLLRQALEAKHFKNWQKLFQAVIKSYKETKRESASENHRLSDKEKTLEQLKKVESRGKYK